MSSGLARLGIYLPVVHDVALPRAQTVLAGSRRGGVR
jgi:hypothetical protein